MANQERIAKLIESLERMARLADEAIEGRRESDDDEDREMLDVYESWRDEAQRLIDAKG